MAKLSLWKGRNILPALTEREHNANQQAMIRLLKIATETAEDAANRITSGAYIDDSVIKGNWTAQTSLSYEQSRIIRALDAIKGLAGLSPAVGLSNEVREYEAKIIERFTPIPAPPEPEEARVLGWRNHETAQVCLLLSNDFKLYSVVANLDLQAKVVPYAAMVEALGFALTSTVPGCDFSWDDPRISRPEVLEHVRESIQANEEGN